MKNIITVCRQGLVRSAAMADVLKMHFEPVDVLAVGHFANSRATIDMLCEWADIIILMEQHYTEHIGLQFRSKIAVCDVGRDNYHNSRHRGLIDFCWNWLRQNNAALGITEHSRRV